MRQPSAEGAATPSASASPHGAVLSDREIERLVRSEQLIVPFDKQCSLQGASYDLCLGPELFAQGEHQNVAAGYTLDPGEFVIVTSAEHLRLPRDLVARAGLMSSWAQRGLVSLFSPQVDPGFEGILIVPLFNAGNAPVALKVGERLITIEFVRMTCPATVAWADQHGPLRGIPQAAQIEMARPDLTALSDRLVEVDSRLSELEVDLKEHKSNVEGLVSGGGLRAARLSWKLALLGVVVAVVAAAVGALVA